MYSTHSEFEATASPVLSCTGFSGTGEAISFERAIDEGKILMVDFPLAGTGGGARTQMIALLGGAGTTILKLFFFQNQLVAAAHCICRFSEGVADVKLFYGFCIVGKFYFADEALRVVHHRNESGRPLVVGQRA